MPEQRLASWSTRVASDVVRDGLGLELLDAKTDVVAEVFRCDADHTVTLWLASGVGLSAETIEWFLAEACIALVEFEDGTPLPARELWRRERT